jgi:hypothetical protein
MVTAGGTDLWAGLVFLGAFAGVIATIVLVIWIIARSRGTTASLAVRATAALAGIWLALAAIGVPISIFRIINGAEVDITEAAGDGDQYCGSAALMCDGSEYLATGVSFGPRLLVELGGLGTTIAIAAPAFALFALCRSALRNSVFPAWVPRMLLVCGTITLLAGSVGPVLATMGAGLAAAEVLPSDAYVFYDFTVPWWPALVALACAAFAAILRHGARLQNDTEGLV